ncbi:MAG: hypothetical protein L6Q54_11780 [Leptospiraceae bacterium]|nr:hypothetical protein [Leptospiraceae bacterium]
MSTTEITTLPNPTEMMRQATDVAGVCGEIVKKTAMEIKGKKYVKVEGWQSIATAHGCVLSSKDVKVLETGISAIGYVRRISDGIIISEAEGFVGFNESTWGGRDEYAQRAMAQTRAMSRAARSAFAHVVVLIDGNLSTTPAEEVPYGGFEKTNEKEKSVNSEPEKIESPIGVLSEGEEVPKEYWKLSTDQKKASLPESCYPKKNSDGMWIVTRKGR